MMNKSHVQKLGVGPSSVVTFDVPVVGKSELAQVVLTPERALELACWIVYVVDPHEKKFDEILRQIEDA